MNDASRTRYDLLDLRLFTIVCEAGGLAAAARRANMSVSALSERIKMLEAEVGAPLLARTARGSTPTSAGLEFAAQARTILLEVERLNGMIAGWREREAGTIVMLANSNAMVSFLPDILAAFLARNPEVVIDLREALSDEIVGAVRSGQADVGVAAETANVAGLDVRPFHQDELVLFVPPGHRFAARRRVDFVDTLGEPFVGLDNNAAIQTYTAAQAAKLGRELNLRIKLRSFDGVGRMVAAGVGIAVAPASTFNRTLHDAGVRSVPLSDSWAIRKLVLCLPPETAPSPVLSRLLQFLTA